MDHGCCHLEAAGSLVQGDGNTVVGFGGSTMQLITTQAVTLNAGTNVVLDAIDGGFGLFALATSLHSSYGDFIFAGAGVEKALAKQLTIC
jgi:hypothetical protein